MSLGSIEISCPWVKNLAKRLVLLEVPRQLETRGVKPPPLFVWDRNLGL